MRNTSAYRVHRATTPQPLTDLTGQHDADGRGNLSSLRRAFLNELRSSSLSLLHHLHVYAVSKRKFLMIVQER